MRPDGFIQDVSILEFRQQCVLEFQPAQVFLCVMTYGTEFFV